MQEAKTTKKKPEWRAFFVYFVLLGLIVLFALLNHNFLTPGNIENIGRQTAMVSIIAFGATFVVTAGHIDLSVGSVVGLVGLTSAYAMKSGCGMLAASLIGLGIGLCAGLVNGLLVAKAKIPAFLVTLGTMDILRGIALTVTNTKAVIITDEGFTRLWSVTSIGIIPISIFWTLLLLLVSIWLYHYTTFGNHVKAMGGNKIAASYSGVRVDRNTILVFMYAGLMAATAGLIMAARLKSGRPEVGAGMELDAVAAAILGGTALSGGRGKMFNTLIGSLIMGVITNGLIILGIQSNIQEIIKGIIIIAAVSLSERNPER